VKLLLVGGTGVLSTAITQIALKKGIEVYIINRGNKPNLIPQDVHLLKSDINDQKNVISLLDNLYFDAVIDFICFTNKQLEYSFNLFKSRTNQYIFISSCAVYDKAASLVCDEDAPKVLPIWKYSIDKYKSEELLINLAKAENINYTIIRPAVTYGNTRIPYGIVPPYGYHWTIVERILHGKPIITWNNGKDFYNITHVDDFAVGVIGLLGNKLAYNEAFNVVGDETPTWMNVLATLGDLLDKEVKTFNLPAEYYACEVPSKKGEILGGRSISAHIINKKIKSVVPYFKQTVTLKAGLQRTLKYYINHNYLSGIDYAFDADSDRIIAKYAKENKISIKGLNLHFFDYLKENKIKDRFVYFLNYYKDNVGMKVFNLIVKMFFRFYKVIRYRC